MLRKMTIPALVLAIAAGLLTGCAGAKTSCIQGTCVVTGQSAGPDHLWPEPAPETPGPAKKVDKKVKSLPTALPPGVVPNPKPSRRSHRVEFHVQRVGTPPIEVEWSVPPSRRSGPIFLAEGERDWRDVEWAVGPGMAHLWVSRVIAGQASRDRERIKCWITVDGQIPDNANRPDGVPSFKADGESTGLFDCYVSAWIPEPAK
jgi:hypothetical protein